MDTSAHNLDPNLVRSLAKSRGWSIFQLCKEAKINHPYLYQFLNGDRTDISDDARRKLAKVFPEAKDVFLLRVRTISEECPCPG